MNSVLSPSLMFFILPKPPFLAALVFCCFLSACSYEETRREQKGEEYLIKTTQNTKKNNQLTDTTQGAELVEMDSVEASLVYNDSVLNRLEVSQAQAQELSETMSEMIVQAQNQNFIQKRDTKEDLPINLSKYLYIKVDSFPKELLPQNIENLYVGANSEKAEQQYLVALEKSGDLQKIAPLPKNFLFNPAKKTAAYYQNERVFICSEQSYKATVICGVFDLDLKNKALTFEAQTARDLSVEAIDKAQKALAEGKIIETVGFYEEVMYPQNYMQVETEVINLLKKAYSISQKLEKEQKYDSVALVLGSVFDFWGTDFLLDIQSPQELQKLFQNNTFAITEKQYLNTLQLYGTALLKTKNYLEATKVYELFTGINPKSAEAYLNLGDAYYGLEKLEKSQLAYQNYKKLNPQKIKRVEERLAEK